MFEADVEVEEGDGDGWADACEDAFCADEGDGADEVEQVLCARGVHDFDACPIDDNEA